VAKLRKASFVVSRFPDTGTVHVLNSQSIGLGKNKEKVLHHIVALFTASCPSPRLGKLTTSDEVSIALKVSVVLLVVRTSTAITTVIDDRALILVAVVSAKHPKVTVALLKDTDIRMCQAIATLVRPIEPSSRGPVRP